MNRPTCKHCGGFLSLCTERTVDGPLDFIYCHACGRRTYRPERSISIALGHSRGRRQAEEEYSRLTGDL